MSEQNATIVDYSGDHSAVTTNVKNIYISKWNKYPLVKHHKNDHPGYGNPQGFYKRTPPLTSVTVSGPTRLIGHQLDRLPQYHATGTWTVNTIGGPNKKYKWYKRNCSQSSKEEETKGSWILLSGETSNTLTYTLYYNYWGIDIQCMVSSGLDSLHDEIHVYVTGDEPDKSISIPQTVTLESNSPNPFNPSTKIKFGLPEMQKVKIDVYSLAGKKIKTLVNNSMTAGYHTINWNATDENGVKVSSGVYIYQLKCGNEVFTNKMIFAK